jgi:hypothetical protein
MAKDNYVYVMNNSLSFIDPLGLYASAPLNAFCAPAYVDSITQASCWCYKLNQSSDDQCECLSDAAAGGDPESTKACKNCKAKFPTSLEQACICTCNALGGKSCDKACKKVCP